MADKPIFAADGLVARKSGPWIAEKHRGLERYLSMASTAMRNKFAGGVIFVDLMCGPGICVDTRTAGRPESPGSTLLALSTRFPLTRIIAVDSKAEYIDALRTRASSSPYFSRCVFIAADSNAPSTIERIREHTARALTLMFVDLLGTEVKMSTLRALTAGRVVDLLITWPEMDVVRNASMMLTQTERWNEFFGTDDWQRIVKNGRLFRVSHLRQLYIRQLEQLEYSTILAPAIKNTKGGRLYRPLFASRDPMGLHFWDAATARPSAQGTFLD